MSGVELLVIMGICLVAWRAGMSLWVVGAIAAGASAIVVSPSVEESSTPVVVADPAARELAGSASCRGCHPKAWNTWQQSFHRTMTQRPKPETVLGHFDTTLTHDGQEWTLRREGDRYSVSRRGPAGDPVTGVVALLTGSHHMQNYWIDVGQGWLIQFPFVWLIETKRWIPASASFLQPPDAPSPAVVWNDSCVYCHTVAGSRGSEAGAQKTQSMVGELGIACEACHGPGQAHVRGLRSPAQRYLSHLSDDPSSTMIHPERLQQAEREAVCSQCHAVFMHRRPRERALTGDPYRPGDAPEATRHVLNLEPAPMPWGDPYLAPTKPVRVAIEYGGGRLSGSVIGLTPSGLYVEPSGPLPMGVSFTLGDRRLRARWVADSTGKTGLLRVGEWPPVVWGAALSTLGYEGLAITRADWDAFWRDATVRTVGREHNGLSISPCATQGDLGCTTCHTMHGDTPQDQLRPGFDSAEACTKCHGALVAEPEAHSHHSLADADCYDCHLPYTTYGLLGAARSHRIDTPSPMAMEARGRPNACNLCHLDRTVRWAEAALARWAGRPEPPVDPPGMVAAGPHWALAGDAAVRAITGWHLGWPRARATAKVDQWAPPVLAILLDDPYAAVRAIAERSARASSVGAVLDYDFIAESADRKSAARAFRAAWKGPSTGAARPEVLLTKDGAFDDVTAARLKGRRDQRPITVAE